MCTAQRGAQRPLAVYLSISMMGAMMFCLFVSTMQPFMTISLSMKCTASKFFMMSSSHTFSKYRSSVSTKE